jgi:lysozyme family protein
VNAGPGIAVRLLQQAINNLGGALVVDGAWGPATVAAANACDQTALVGAYRIVRQAYYQAVVDHNPASGPYLPGWEARATE